MSLHTREDVPCLKLPDHFFVEQTPPPLSPDLLQSCRVQIAGAALQADDTLDTANDRVCFLQHKLPISVSRQGTGRM